MKNSDWSKNNWFAMYYNWIYGEYPPDICSFFWGSLFALGLFPIIIPGRIFLGLSDAKKDITGEFFLGIFSWIIYGATIFVGMLVVDAFGYKYTNLWGYLVLGSLLGALTLGAIILAIVGTIYVSVEKVPNTTVVQNTKDFIGAIRGKYCTKITWKE